MTARALAKHRGLRPGLQVLEHLGAGELSVHSTITHTTRLLATKAEDPGDVTSDMHVIALKFRQLFLNLGIEPVDWPLEQPFKQVPRDLEALKDRLKLLKGRHEESGL